MVEWKNVIGYENKYQVSDCGLVKRCLFYDSLGRTKKEKELSQKQTSNGYMQVDLWCNGKRKSVGVHRLVFENFVGKIGKCRIIHHVDGNKQNNHIQNLQEISCLEHNKHHNTGRKAWNAGKKYGLTSAYKKALASRKKTILKKAEEAYNLNQELNNNKLVAKELNVSRRSVWKRIKQYKIYLETGNLLPSL